jgi:phosphate transport system protein
MKDHTVTAFDIELRQLAQSIAEMGALARQAIVIATAALGAPAPALADEAEVIDRQVDRLQRAVEEAGILLIARRQPVAFDLREVLSTLRIANDLERIGDLAGNIATRVAALGETATPQSLALSLQGLASRVIERLDLVLAAFRVRDPAQALEIWSSDGSVKDLYTTVFRSVLTYMMEDPRHISSCAQLVFVAKNLERIGDHVSNIAESVYYAATGDQLDDVRRDTEAVTDVEAVAAS